MRLVRQFQHQRGTGLPDIRRGEALRNARVPRAHPIGENDFRAFQHRLDGPESIVEVEADRADDASVHPVHGNEGKRLDPLLLTIGNKNYSSWSLRPWILLKHLGLGFSERLMPLDTPEFARDVGTVSPTRRVPVLEHGDL